MRHVAASENGFAMEFVFKKIHENKGGIFTRAGEDKGVGPSEVIKGLAQRAPGQKVHVAEGPGCVEEDEVQVSVEFDMLKAVVKNEEIGSVLVMGQKACMHAVF